jgi:hypothetical protein
VTVESGVFAILSTSADLAAAAGVALPQLPPLILRAGSVVDGPDRWLAVRWEEPTLFGNLGNPRFTLRAHDRDRTYTWIDAVLNAAKTTLTAVVHQQGITQVDWRGRSPDLVDDGYGTLTKYDTYVVAAGLNTGRK